MTRYLFLAVILLTFLAAGTYAYLGGLRTPTTTLETTAAPVLLAGQYFRGPAQAEEFGPLFRQAKEVQDAGKLRGELANLYYNSPEKARDTIQAFVGLAVTDTTQTLPTGWRYRVVPAGRRVVAARLQGVSLMLSPNKLYPAAFNAVKQQKLTERGDFYLEKFGANETAEVWIGVK